MIAVDIPVQLLWALRWALFLGPLAAVLVLAYCSRSEPRRLVGGLFAFLYGLGLIFVTHQLAMALGCWRYGGDALMLMGLPADIWIGGALLFGPVLYFAFPNIAPLWLTLPVIIGLHGTIFSSLKPLVWAGPGWFAGVVFVFLAAHIPAIYLARWTARGERLALRATLLAVGYGFLAFGVLPALIMHSMGGTWDLDSRPLWLLLLCAPCLALCMLMGLAAVQAFVVHGQGTPIPLDPTRRLVRTGLFAYVSNPMQLCTALAWIFLGVALGNIWVAAASVMAWVFVQGMVRWHHRNDLLVRFPDGWPAYRAHVPEWIPRWRPWVPESSRLLYDPGDRRQRRAVDWLRRRDPAGIDFAAVAGTRALTYFEPHESCAFIGPAAVAKALNHGNFAFALVGAGMLLVILPFGALGPLTFDLGLGHLLRIRQDQLAFYDEMKRRHGDAVLLRLGPYRSWLLFDPGLIEQVLVRQFRSFVRFEKLMRVIAQWTGDNMLVSEGANCCPPSGLRACPVTERRQ